MTCDLQPGHDAGRLLIFEQRNRDIRPCGPSGQQCMCATGFCPMLKMPQNTTTSINNTLRDVDPTSQIKDMNMRATYNTVILTMKVFVTRSSVRKEEFTLEDPEKSYECKMAKFPRFWLRRVMAAKFHPKYVNRLLRSSPHMHHETTMISIYDS